MKSIPSKQIRSKIDGILLLDKPLHMTSNGVLQRVKRLFAAKKAGHTGSLDPLASGMLPICFGEATKVSQFLLDSDKYYRATIKLGIKTTTGDAEGEVISTRVVGDLTTDVVMGVLNTFLGEIQQIPPMFSALKFQGKPLYELARKGIEIERKPRTIRIHALNQVMYERDILVLDVHCSKGTYIRTLAEDIGEALGCGAHVAGLHRTAVAPYEKNCMFSLAELETQCTQFGSESLLQYLLPIDTSVQHLLPVNLTASATFYMRMGQSVMVSGSPKEGWVRIFSDSGRFMGIGEIASDGRVTPRRLVQ